jgi:two-component system response regulator LytT
MKILIIEDEQAAARRLEKLVLELAPQAIILGRLDSVEQTTQWLSENPPPELMLMDIHLADGSSFEIFQHVQISCPVIFITAFDEYALQAFKVNAIDYLLKPVKLVELKTALEKYEKRSPKTSADYSSLVQLLRAKDQDIYLKRMLIRLGSSIKLVEVSDAAYFYTKDKITFMVSKNNGKRLPIDYPLDKLETLIDPKLFFRINRQVILSIPAIKEMHTYSKSRVKIDLEPPVEIESIVSTERAAEFKKWLVGEIG